MTQKCLICKSDQLERYKLVVRNRYSEEFSKILNLSIENLENTFSNFICKKCGFIYKKKWFSKKITKKIYSENVSSHPRGWDTISNKFNYFYLNKQFQILEKLILNRSNILKINHIKRNIYGVLNSLVVKKKIFILKKKIINAVHKNDIKTFRKLKSQFNFRFEAIEFSRYSGFKSLSLFNFLNLKLRGIKKYGEIGCPLWGMIDIAKKHNCKTYFIKPESDVFWGTNCKYRNLNCFKKLSDTITLTGISKLKKNELDYLGIYNLLDHYENPTKTLTNLFKFTKAIGIITEKNINGIPIQHHNILSPKSIKYIAKLCEKKVSMVFNQNLSKTDYNFYLLY